MSSRSSKHKSNIRHAEVQLTSDMLFLVCNLLGAHTLVTIYTDNLLGEDCLPIKKTRGRPDQAAGKK